MYIIDISMWPVTNEHTVMFATKPIISNIYYTEYCNIKFSGIILIEEKACTKLEVLHHIVFTLCRTYTTHFIVLNVFVSSFLSCVNLLSKRYFLLQLISSEIFIQLFPNYNVFSPLEYFDEMK